MLVNEEEKTLQGKGKIGKGRYGDTKVRQVKMGQRVGHTEVTWASSEVMDCCCCCCSYIVVVMVAVARDGDGGGVVEGPFSPLFLLFFFLLSEW